jgi:hypothetical protein
MRTAVRRADGPVRRNAKLSASVVSNADRYHADTMRTGGTRGGERTRNPIAQGFAEASPSTRLLPFDGVQLAPRSTYTHLPKLSRRTVPVKLIKEYGDFNVRGFTFGSLACKRQYL